MARILVPDVAAVAAGQRRKERAGLAKYKKIGPEDIAKYLNLANAIVSSPITTAVASEVRSQFAGDPVENERARRIGLAADKRADELTAGEPQTLSPERLLREKAAAQRLQPASPQVVDTPTKVLQAPPQVRQPVTKRETPRGKALRHLSSLSDRLKATNDPNEADRINKAITAVKQRYTRDSLNLRLPMASDAELEAMAERLEKRNPTRGSRSEAALMRILEEQERRSNVELPEEQVEPTIAQPQTLPAVGPGQAPSQGQAPLPAQSNIGAVAAPTPPLAEGFPNNTLEAAPLGLGREDITQDTDPYSLDKLTGEITFKDGTPITPVGSQDLISSDTELKIGGLKVPFKQKTTTVQPPAGTPQTVAIKDLPTETLKSLTIDAKQMNKLGMLKNIEAELEARSFDDKFRDVSEDIPQSFNLRTLPEIAAFAATADTPAKRAIALEAAARVQVQPRNALEALGIGVQGSARNFANIARVKALFPKGSEAVSLLKAKSRAELDYARAKRLQSQAISDEARAKKIVAQTKDIDAKRAASVDLLIARSTKARAGIIIGLRRAEAAILRAKKRRGGGRRPAKSDISDLQAVLRDIDKVGSNSASELRGLNSAKRRLDAVPDPGTKPSQPTGGFTSGEQKAMQKWRDADGKKRAAKEAAKQIAADLKEIKKDTAALKTRRDEIVKQIGQRRGTSVKPSRKTTPKRKTPTAPVAKTAESYLP